jgi:GDPmannose 4,6-dehydratase
MKRAIVVGSSGQDGRILVSQLAEANYEVLGLTSTAVLNLKNGETRSFSILNSHAVESLVRDWRPDEIYYLAAYHHSSQDAAVESDEIWRVSSDVHVEGFRNFLEAVRQVCRPARVFYASSSRVFGMPECSPQSEACPMRPRCIYGITKATGMMLARRYREVHGCHVSGGILYNHESPLRPGNFLSQKVVQGLAAIKHHRQSKLEIGSLEARVDWGYAPDYTRAMQLIVRIPQSADYVVATGETHSVKDLIEVAAGWLGLDWKRIVDVNSAVLRRPSLPLCGDASLLRVTTGWRPTITFDKMVQLMVQAAEAKLQEHGTAESQYPVGFCQPE